VTQLEAPSRGDLLWLDFDPQAGREQAGRRPALVLSPLAFNRLTGLALVCPITRTSRGFRFEVSLPAGGPVEGIVLSDHARTLDWRVRGNGFIAKADASVVFAVIARVRTLLD
jgi:mRNA interferase MazF